MKVRHWGMCLAVPVLFASLAFAAIGERLDGNGGRGVSSVTADEVHRLQPTYLPYMAAEGWLEALRQQAGRTT